MTSAIITSPTSLSRAIGDLREAFAKGGWMRVSWTHDKTRSGQQNALSHVWYEQVAQELRENTPLGIKCECKLRYGVPILRAEDAEFRQAYDAAIKPLTYETKLEAMKVWPVTSRMNTDQLSQYLTDVQAAYLGRVTLQFPDEWRWAA